MGREVKRVALDFEWPENMPWKGYVNPYSSQQCKMCDGTGYNQATKEIYDDWYSFDKAEWLTRPNGGRYNNLAWQNHITEVEVEALLKANRLWDFTRVPVTEEQKQIVKDKIANGGNSWLPFSNGVVPTPQEVNLWNLLSLGHDAINMMICVEARAKHLGVYGPCAVCNGDGEIWFSEPIKQLNAEWKPIEPPEGTGWQIWETVSEGSPISPVFETSEELARYMSTTRWGADKGTSYEDWLRFITVDKWRPSLVLEGNKIPVGVSND